MSGVALEADDPAPLPMPATKRAGSGARSLIRCPHCDGPSFIRTSETITETVKNVFVHCLNTACGHTWKSQISFLHTISPSAKPRLDLALPTCPPEHVRHRYQAGTRPPANDSGPANDI